MKKKLQPYTPTLFGFTHLELMAVIVVVGVLAAILLPAILNVRHTAKSVEAISTLRNFANGAFLHKAETGYLAPHRRGDQINQTRLWFFQYFVTHYFDRNPMAAKNPFDNWDSLANSWPIPGSESRVKISYGRNGDYPLLNTSVLALPQDQAANDNIYWPPNESQIDFPAETAYFLESNHSRIYRTQAPAFLNFYHKNGNAIAVAFFDGNVQLVNKVDLVGDDEGSPPTWSEIRLSKFWTGRMPE